MKNLKTLAGTLAILLIASATPAMTDTGRTQAADISRSVRTSGTPRVKLGLPLWDLQSEFQTFRNNSRQPAVAFQPSQKLVRTLEGRVFVDAVASGDAELLLAKMQELGLEGGARYGRVVSGLFPIGALRKLGQLDELKFARPSYAITRVGAVTSQGDIASDAFIAKPAFGVDGTGVTVGMLSDSYDCLGGAGADIASGDLPPALVFLTDFSCPGTDEGRAMLQLVRDIAPGSSLAFHTAFVGKADFALGITELATIAGADVIVDDVVYLTEPFFQDGIVAQAVDSVVGMGVSYFSAAGNQARQSYEDDYRPSGLTPAGIGSDSHDFDPGGGTDALQGITILVGDSITMSFQWDDPFFSVSGAPGATTDLDIFLMDATGTVVVAASSDANIGADPIELLSYTNPGPGTSFSIVIEKIAGPDPGRIKYIEFDGDYTPVEFDTASGTVYGHANAVGAMAVGSAAYFATPPFGTSPPVLEAGSSAGPTPILFDTLGNALVTPEVRGKPEIVCIDATDTTFFSSSDIEPNGFPNFFGTSASAPHVAGIAALMLEANTGLQPAQIYSFLEIGAIDMDDPSTGGFDVGFDFGSGFGLCDADAAVTSADVCSDGVVDPLTEECDDGNLINGDGCDNNCTFTACGNGIATGGENCDDANLDDFDDCRNNCIFPATCWPTAGP